MFALKKNTGKVHKSAISVTLLRASETKKKDILNHCVDNVSKIVTARTRTRKEMSKRRKKEIVFPFGKLNNKFAGNVYTMFDVYNVHCATMNVAKDFHGFRCSGTIFTQNIYLL